MYHEEKNCNEHLEAPYFQAAIIWWLGIKVPLTQIVLFVQAHECTDWDITRQHASKEEGEGRWRKMEEDGASWMLYLAMMCLQCSSTSMHGWEVPCTW